MIPITHDIPSDSSQTQSFMSDPLPYLAHLASTLMFATAGQMYAHYSKRFSALWMNAWKAAVSLGGSLIVVALLYGFRSLPWAALLSITVSGIMGLLVADLFILRSFARIGPARTLVFYGFHPLLTGVGSYFLFAQEFNFSKLIALVFFLGCLFTFSLERYRESGRWELSGILGALLGVSLDAFGVLLSRHAFEAAPLMEPIEGHLYRCFGAGIGFFLLSLWKPYGFTRHFRELSQSARFWIVFGSFLGTFVSLWLALYAVQRAHLATLSAISISGPMFAALLESILHRKRPSKYLLISLLCFCAGAFTLYFLGDT